jgi:hypothetical protein
VGDVIPDVEVTLKNAILGAEATLEKVIFDI